MKLFFIIMFSLQSFIAGGSIHFSLKRKDMLSAIAYSVLMMMCLIACIAYLAQVGP